MNRIKQSGFTLVEIAIVLVIIGLLLGGILKGQELINSARVRNLADQNSAIQAAYYGFIDRYRKVPGDMQEGEACDALGSSNFLSGCVGGDGDGRLEQTSDGGTAGDEPAAVWAHLLASNFITGQYDGQPATGTDYDIDTAPVNAFQGPVKLVFSSEYHDENTSGSGTPQERLSYFFGRGIPVNISRELDIKLDNGQPDSGIVRSSSNTTTGDPEYANGDCTVESSDTGEFIWNIDSNQTQCNAVYIY